MHTGIFVNESDIIHCNYGYNGITINDYNKIASANVPYYNGGLAEFIYRKESSTEPKPSTSVIGKTFVLKKDAHFYNPNTSKPFRVDNNPTMIKKGGKLKVVAIKGSMYQVEYYGLKFWLHKGNF